MPPFLRPRGRRGYGKTPWLGLWDAYLKSYATMYEKRLSVASKRDIPELKTVVLESETGPWPYNAKGIGENPVGPVAPAIANAVADAVGVRIKNLPITAEKVYQALEGR